jgi:hypothetical protein
VRSIFFLCGFLQLEVFSGKTKPISLNEMNNVEDHEFVKVGL